MIRSRHFVLVSFVAILLGTAVFSFSAGAQDSSTNIPAAPEASGEVQKLQAESSLNAEDARNFVDSLPEIVEFSEKLKESGKTDFMSAQESTNMQGGFRPYSQSLGLFKEKAPEDYRELEKLVKKHGFSSAEVWGNVGQKIVVTYLVLKLEQDNPQALEMMPNFNEEQLQTVPEAARNSYRQMAAMTKALKAVSDKDKEIVTPLVDQLGMLSKFGPQQ